MSEYTKEEIKSAVHSDTSSTTNIEDVQFTIYNRNTKEQIGIKKDWTAEEEKAAVRKVDFIVIPLLFFAFFILQMDRGNISNALTDTLMKDIKINTNQVNVGTALFNVGIVIFEIPSNILLQKIGPAKWLSFQVLVWSLIATLQSQIKNYGQFLATRFLLGMFEAGFIPGALFYLSTWYTKKELTLRYTTYFLGNLLAGAVSGLIAAGILQDLSGRDNLAAWKWIFIIEGVVGVGYGIIFSILLPDSSIRPRPFWAKSKGFNILTERQQYILSQRIIIDDPEKLTNTSAIGLGDLKNIFSKSTIWIHFVLSLSSMIMSQALSTYTPLIIKSFGYSKVEANARSSISGWMGIILLVIMAYVSNHFKPRGASIAFLLLWKLIFIIVLRAIPDKSTATVKFAILTVLNTAGANAHVLNTSWLSLNCKTPVERSISLAMVVMAANIAGICGGQVLRENDRPYYHKGFLAIIIVSAFALLWSIGIIVSYYLKNRRLDATNPKTDFENIAEQQQPPLENVIIFVGKGDPERDSKILDSIKGDYHIQDKELESIQNLRNFRYTP